MSVHPFSMQTIDGQETKLEAYAGKVLLLVNVASKCGLTPQYEGLQKLYEQYKDKGLEILGFPCNQFGGQEPGTNEEVKSFCSVNYGVTFPMFAKIDVNGENAHPLYAALTNNGAEPIAWNFTKFLVGRDGEVVKRFEPQTVPADLAGDIEAML